MITQYKHNSLDVSVVSEFVGKHKEICICHQGCAFFHPNTDDNCPYAEQAYALSVQIGIVLVMECDLFRAIKGDENGFY